MPVSADPAALNVQPDVVQLDVNAAVGGTLTVPPAAWKCAWIFGVLSTDG